MRAMVLLLITFAVPTQSPSFEVASVKPNKSDVAEGISLSPNGSVRYAAFHLRTLIAIAYGSPTTQRFDQFVGGPSWLNTDRFDIVAKAEGDISTDAQGRRSDRLTAMLRALLEDRFRVSVHQEMREMPAFTLRLSRRDGTLGPQIHKSTIECPRFVTGTATPDVGPAHWCGVRAGGGRITGHSVSAAQLAGNLSGYDVVGRPVADRTGLVGRYDFEIEYAPTLTDAADPAAGGPSLFTAVVEQLGLRLQSEKLRLPVIVIDHAEQPTPD